MALTLSVLCLCYSDAEWLSFSTTINNLPQATRIIFSVAKDDDEEIAWCGCTLAASVRCLRSGLVSLRLLSGRCPSPTVPDMEVNNWETEGFEADRHTFWAARIKETTHTLMTRIQRLPNAQTMAPSLSSLKTLVTKFSLDLPSQIGSMGPQ